MQPHMTEVIAVRTFWWENAPERRITVSIGKPAQPADSLGEFYCPIRVDGFDNGQRIEAIYGVDAFQALELAMRYVCYRISDIDEKSGGRLRWQYGDNQRIPQEWAQPSD